MELFSLIYTSTPTRPFSQEDLEDLARVSQRNNAEREISGLLLYSQRFFLQVIEGDYDDIAELYITLEHDDRHRDLQLLTAAPASRRVFPDWSMGVLDISRSARVEPELVCDICNRAEQDLDAAGNAAIVLLELFKHDPINASGLSIAS
jgi:hypothetical protein